MYLRQLACLSFFFFGGLVFSPGCWLLWAVAGRWIPASAAQRAISRTFAAFVRWMESFGGIELRTEGLEKIRKLRGTIIAANHPGLLDAVLLLAHQPRAACVMRASLLRNPIFCGPALLGRYVRNDSGPAFVREAVEKLATGGNLLIFPEGTRTRHGAVNPFKHGFALIACHSGAPVQTIVIESSGYRLAKGVSMLHPAVLPLRITLRLGERFEVAPGESPRELGRRIEDWFRAKLNTEPGAPVA